MMNKISNNPVLFLDWILCCLFGFLALCGFVAVFLVADKHLLIGSTFGLSLMSLIWSPLFRKTGSVRAILILMTLFIAIL
ncbi:hypothetical protein [Myxosarcina sp. GI1]|uniref:hypothetical protein n=1 Tax=Myxosarcina sp. GI1 TaxID=1541065 RepID=UPI0012E066DB|nr:hypothetical protein [Myxosarcina sp. GI1]